MAVRVRYFARLREVLGTAEESLPVPEQGIDFAGFMAQLRERHGSRACGELGAARIRLALNGELLSEPPAQLHPGDELGFLPPVTGG